MHMGHKTACLEDIENSPTLVSKACSSSQCKVDWANRQFGASCRNEIDSSHFRDHTVNCSIRIFQELHVFLRYKKQGIKPLPAYKIYLPMYWKSILDRREIRTCTFEAGPDSIRRTEFALNLCLWELYMCNEEPYKTAET